MAASAAVLAPALAGGQTADHGSWDPQYSNPNPLKTNVPSLAWRGEELRFVKCRSDFANDEFERLRPPDGSSRTDYDVEFIVESWSGTEWSPNQPHVEKSTVDVFYRDGGRYEPASGLDQQKDLCFKGNVVSLHPGLARIKMIITRKSEVPAPPPENTATAEDGQDGATVVMPASPPRTDEIVVKHQFLAIWLSLNSVDVENVTDSKTPTEFIAGGKPGLIKAQVDGTFPYAGQTWTLPDDWPALAKKVAVDQNASNLHDEYRWDIHDDTTEAEGHPLYRGASPMASYGRGRCDDERPEGLAPRLDAVDNCVGGKAFSRAWDPDGPHGAATPYAFDLTEKWTVGPFDPKRPDETFLPDGHLTPDDAPMPAAQLDLSIARNKGDVGGAGFFAEADKDGIFRRGDDRHGWEGDHEVDGDPERVVTQEADSHAEFWSAKAHSLYAPFYSRYIPATAAPTNVASGTDGPTGNNYPGYLVHGKYDFWDFAHVFARGVGDSKCLYRAWDLWKDRKSESSGYHDTPSSPLPEGPQKVAVYTDEHGQAYVRWFPGWAFFPPPLNNNQACDFEGRDVLGTSDIKATARYPYQPVDAAEPSDDLERLNIRGNKFRKDLIVFPKGKGENNSRLLVAHAQDIFGKPFKGEKVCFQRVGAEGGISPYLGGRQTLETGKGDEYVVDGFARDHEAPVDMLCTRLNHHGNAVIEVDGSKKTQVLAIFIDERLKRFCDVPLGEAPAVIAPCDRPPVPKKPHDGNGTPGNGNPGTGNGTPGTGNGTPGTVVGPPPVSGTAPSQGQTRVSPSRKKKAKTRLQFARLLTSRSGKRRLQLRLDGSRKSAKIRIRFGSRSGKTLRTVTRRVLVGRTIVISGLKVPAGARKVRITIVG